MKNIIKPLKTILIIILGLVIGSLIAIYAQPDIEHEMFCPSGYIVAERDCEYPIWLNIILFIPIIITPLLLLWLYKLKRNKNASNK